MSAINTGKIIKAARVVVQITVLVLITWVLMAVPSVAVMSWYACIEHWMIVPIAVLGSLSAIGFWLAITLLFGRLYCSWVCPIGTLQDVGEWVYKKLRPNRVYRYQEPNPPYVRIAMWCLFIMAALFGSMAVSWTLIPFLQLSPLDSYSSITLTTKWLLTGETPIAVRVAVSAGINLIFLLLMGALKGRSVCNTLCPTGGCLGTINHFAILQFEIDTDRCTHCFKCEYNCKANCINSLHGTVDAGRCVSCFNCVAVCPDDAIHYTTRRHRLQLPLMQPIKRRTASLNIECTDFLESSHKTITPNDNETIS